jgi:hypothetical protein
MVVKRVLKESTIQRLSVFETKILRKIFGPIKEDNGIWRIKTNKELDELIKHQNIIYYVKAQRLSWFGHINRMPETSIPLLQLFTMESTSDSHYKQCALIEFPVAVTEKVGNIHKWLGKVYGNAAVNRSIVHR